MPRIVTKYCYFNAGITICPFITVTFISPFDSRNMTSSGIGLVPVQGPRRATRSLPTSGHEHFIFPRTASKRTLAEFVHTGTVNFCVCSQSRNIGAS